MTKAYLGLGSNLGNKRENITKAIELIGKHIGSVIRQSAFIETEPWGFESDNGFVNAAVCVETELTPRQLLENTQQIERSMGRKQKSRNGIYHDRIIDIDILLYGNMIIIENDLIVPHPFMHKRDFVMIPLREILDDDIYIIDK